MRPTLIVTSGLPGTGKSAVAERLSAALSAPVVSIDPIEAAMWGGRHPTGDDRHRGVRNRPRRRR